MKIILLITLGLACAEATSLMDWIWSKPATESSVLVSDGVPLVAIPYESMTDDEKFLQEAAKFTDIQVSSPLEICQHKVIMRIRTSCSSLSEEALAKLSVNLLNCQSAVEGRKIFPCTDEMSLKQCTTDMDADMWNAYHLMSNRARAVCYAARSTQFRALTELTVNKLMQSARSQIEALGTLKESQDRLESQTVEALTSLADGNKILVEQQQHLREAQSSAHRLVANNLRELTNEKALIRTGHTLIASMTEDIKQRLEKASQELMDQASERQKNHQEVLKDLMNIQSEAHLIWEKIEESTNRIVQQNADAAAQYEQTLAKLEKINDTIHFIWNVTESMRTEIDDKLGWITEYIGNTGEQLHRVYKISMHIVYLLAAMIVAAFLNAPFLTRATIMGLVPLNLITFLKHGLDACLDFTSITVLIFFITAMHYLMIGIQQVIIGDSKKAKTAQNIQDEQIGTGNGHVPQRSLTPAPPGMRVSTVNVITRLRNTIRDLTRALIQQIIRCKDTTLLILQSAASWCRQNTSPVEELSCSYLPSRKNREDLIMDYSRGDQQSMLSDDLDNSLLHPNRLDETDDSVDTGIRRRLHYTRQSPTPSYSGSPSRSVTPSSTVSPRMLCVATTKTGAKCRSRAQPGRYFCGRHSQGSSILGD